MKNVKHILYREKKHSQIEQASGVMIPKHTCKRLQKKTYEISWNHFVNSIEFHPPIMHGL